MEDNTEKEMEDDNIKSGDDKDIAAYRNMLIEIEQRVAEQFDKTILTIAGGALAISLAFIKDVVGEGTIQKGWLLVTSWASLTACLIFILISFYFGLLAYRKAQDQVDDNTIKNETPGGYYSKILITCNALGIVLLCVGLITLFTFAYNNLSKETENGPKTYTSTNSKTSTCPKTDAGTTTSSATGQGNTVNRRLPACAATKTSKVDNEAGP